ncbi:hypothetical protein NKI54_33965, partial [Mesorhizobium sp. M0663]|uniref:hypothetical protein n=1 Tax=Mesorhizobium sp. M0663 TaxID=2956981 RepID=UPI00333A0081
FCSSSSITRCPPILVDTSCIRALNSKRCGEIRAYIVLARRPDENSLVGLIETSLFMNWSSTRVRFWWTDIISDAALGLRFDVDGMRDAEAHGRHCRAKHPNWEITVWDAHDENLPISIDWNAWADADDKYCHRNPTFAMKE